MHTVEYALELDMDFQTHIFAERIELILDSVEFEVALTDVDSHNHSEVVLHNCLRDVFDIDIEKSSPWWVRILFSKQIVKYSLPLLKGKKITDADCTIDNLMLCMSGVSVLYYYGFWQDFRILLAMNRSSDI